MPQQQGGGGDSMEQKGQAKRNKASQQGRSEAGSVDKKLNGPNRPSV